MLQADKIPVSTFFAANEKCYGMLVNSNPPMKWNVKSETITQQIYAKQNKVMFLRVIGLPQRVAHNTKMLNVGNMKQLEKRKVIRKDVNAYAI